MNIKLIIIVGIALVLGVLGLVLPRYSTPSDLGGTTRAATTVANTFTVSGSNATTLGGTLAVTGNSTLSGTLAVTGATTLTGAQSLTASTTFSVLQMNASTSADGIVMRATNTGQCTLFTYSGTTGDFATSSITCP